MTTRNSQQAASRKKRSVITQRSDQPANDVRQHAWRQLAKRLALETTHHDLLLPVEEPGATQ
jgi:hypothetical protein